MWQAFTNWMICWYSTDDIFFVEVVVHGIVDLGVYLREYEYDVGDLSCGAKRQR